MMVNGAEFVSHKLKMLSYTVESSSGENCCLDNIRVTRTLFLEKKQAAEEFVRTSLNAEHLYCHGVGAETSEADIWKLK